MNKQPCLQYKVFQLSKNYQSHILDETILLECKKCKKDEKKKPKHCFSNRFSMKNLEQNFSIIKEKQAPQLNNISRQKGYNENWRKIIRSRYPEFNKVSINTFYQTSCSPAAYSTNLSLYSNKVITFFFTNGRVSIKHIGRGCMVCTWRKTRQNESLMGTLPLLRVEQGNPPFFRSDVDFFGPIYVMLKRPRVKRWGCIFVCMSAWAVHIELAESLDTDSFINAMQRLFNQWGCLSLIVSDCGANFEGEVN